MGKPQSNFKMASVWQITILSYPGKTFLFGLVMERGTWTSKGSSFTPRNIFAIASSYFRKTLSYGSVRAEWGGKSHITQTDNKGVFYLKTDHPYAVGQDFNLFLDEKPLPYNKNLLNTYFFHKNNNLVISDIDDTILVSHTRKKLKRLMTTLFNTYAKRKPVMSTVRLFDALGRSQYDFFYVSRSEFNLFPLLSNFLKHHDLPKGPLFLTPFISFKELVRNEKDPDFKIKTINLLLDHSPHQNVVLIGDDSQHDLEVYAEISKIHGNRIKRVYIRQTDPNIDRRRSNTWDYLKKNTEIMLYYNDTANLNTFNT